MVYLVALLAAAALSVAFTPLFMRFALAVGLLDFPGPRRVHTKPTVRGGGVAIFLSFWLTSALAMILSPGSLHFIDQTIFSLDKNLVGVFLGAVILLAAGLWDDVKPIKPGYKLLFQTIAAFMPVAFGIRIWWLSNPFGGLNIVLGNVSHLIVPAWLVLMMNVMNWLDGIDGLASGVAAIACAILVALSLAPFVNQPATALAAAILTGASLGFLPFNFHPAKVFLGDSGSQFLGYMIGIFAIISGGKLATASLVMGIPILDALWVIARRIISGGSPFTADRRHLHHRFLDIGLTQRQTVVIYYVISALFGMIALVTKTYGKVIAGMWLIGLMGLVAVTLVTRQWRINQK
ncbi:undecaprenyl/decaprenyl-phosphate alpha-N-acetylglucosaminyl 1-phosphate transferase [Candidatus Berkelbacteria bacterium]|nr:undecaprenyl/decaprenyl-phosphate alpha-N-acetylglucosaminyl 1-phosphate transferase [Candidatus Berkelbacteria bacterium]